MEANIFINNQLNHGLLIHPKMNTAYMLGPFILQPKGGYDSITLEYPLGDLGVLNNTFLLTDTSRVVDVDGLYVAGSSVITKKSSTIGRVYLTNTGTNYTLICERSRYADRTNGTWHWNSGLAPIFGGEIWVYIGAERG